VSSRITTSRQHCARLAILLTVVAINLVGDRLRDALDPRVR
jgi:ABC-type dipeptide/oligopeptide/nickel transport system permease subunit